MKRNVVGPLVCFFAAVLVGCAPAPAAPPPAAAATPSEPEHEHGDEPEPSDLDRPVAELAAARCEHEKPTHQCEECRYEVGFVRVDPSLLAGGLLSTAVAARTPVAVPLRLTGEVRFDERRVGHVSTQVEGLVRKVHVALGDRVKAGQPLLEIESVVVGEGQSAAAEANGLLELSRRNFTRVAELRAENIASEKEYLLAKQELEAAEIRAAGARSRLDRLGTGGTSGGRSVLRAPMDGRVLEMHAVSGEIARSEESLVTIGDNSAVWIEADLYERDLAIVSRGQAAGPLAATVQVRGWPGEDFHGVLGLVSPSMDERSRTVKVRVEAKNPDGRLLAGMFAEVKLFLPGKEEAVSVPRVAVMEDEGRSFVFVAHEGDYWVRRPVVPGRSWADRVELREGLQAGTTVVATGAFLLKSDVLRSKMGAGCAD